MIIFFDIASVAILALIVVLMICGIVYSMLSVYSWLLSHIVLILLIFIIKPVFQCIYLANNKELESPKKHIILVVVTNVLQIVSFWVVIKHMSVLQDAHPVVTGICTVLALGGYAFPLLMSIFGVCDGVINAITSVSNIICCVLLIIACIVPSLGWKIFLFLLSGFVGFSLAELSSGE